MLLGFVLQDCWEVAVEEVVVDGFVLAVGDLVIVEVVECYTFRGQ